ncbi:hypothetical protein C8R45DRAFT_1077673 [Mycena sanguinolenta]|nr:hypothetical protein C8R45DRAFT_1077673 [Mycena sanguinolenta]
MVDFLLADVGGVLFVGMPEISLADFPEHEGTIRVLSVDMGCFIKLRIECQYVLAFKRLSKAKSAQNLVQGQRPQVMIKPADILGAFMRFSFRLHHGKTGAETSPPALFHRAPAPRPDAEADKTPSAGAN